MRQPGRRSAASLAAVPVDRLRPSPPPEHLSEEAKAIWWAIVGGLRHDWFQSCECLLECFCESAVIERQLAGELSKCSIGSERYGELLRLFLAVVGTMAAVATKLRLTPQSSRDSRNVKLIPPGPYPWENRSEEAEPPRDGNERDFSVLLQQQRTRGRAMLTTTEALDVAAFLGAKSEEEAPGAA